MPTPKFVSKFVSRLMATLMVSVVLVTLAGVPAQAQDDRLQVMASFSIAADVVSAVAGDAADVSTIIPLGNNPHAYAPSAQDVARLSEADVVFVVDVNFEEGLLPVVSEAVGSRMSVLSMCVPIRPIEVALGEHHHHEGEAHEHEGEHHHHEAEAGSAMTAVAAQCETHHEIITTAFGADEATLFEGTLGPLYTLDCGQMDEHDHHEHEGQHTHAVGSCDSHVWMDPVNVALWTLMIRDTLSALDPAHADEYAANADAYLAELVALHDEVQAMLAPVPADRRYIVTNHLAFGYFAHRFGLTLVGVVIPGGSTTSEPSVQEVLDLIETIKEYHVPAIFTETTVSEDLARQIADEAGASIVRLYTGSLSAPGAGADTYLNYMRFNAQAMAEALR